MEGFEVKAENYEEIDDFDDASLINFLFQVLADLEEFLETVPADFVPDAAGISKYAHVPFQVVDDDSNGSNVLLLLYLVDALVACLRVNN